MHHDVQNKVAMHLRVFLLYQVCILGAFLCVVFGLKSHRISFRKSFSDVRAQKDAYVEPTGSYLQKLPAELRKILKPKTKQIWSEDDLEQLVALKDSFLSWEKIGEKLNRTDKACTNRYYVLQQKLFYSNMEQQMIVNLTVSQGNEDWENILKEASLSSELNKGVCHRYYLQSQRRLTSGPWNGEEDELLLSIYADSLKCWVYGKNKQFDDNTLQTLSDLCARVGDPNSRDLTQSQTRALSLQAYNYGPILNWRNMSSIVSRSSVDCRRRFSTIVLGRDLKRLSDVWYESETSQLQNLVRQRGSKWREIGRTLGRSPSQCYQAYHYHTSANNFVGEFNSNVAKNSGNLGSNETTGSANTKKSSTKDLWGPLEDLLLLELVKKHQNSWRKIGAEIGRPSTQCFQRFRILNAEAVGVWTEEEYGVLSSFVQSWGAQWTAIGYMLGKSAYVCREAYKRLVERANKAIVLDQSNQAEAPASVKEDLCNVTEILPDSDSDVLSPLHTQSLLTMPSARQVSDEQVGLARTAVAEYDRLLSIDSNTDATAMKKAMGVSRNKQSEIKEKSRKSTRDKESRSPEKNELYNIKLRFRQPRSTDDAEKYDNLNRYNGEEGTKGIEGVTTRGYGFQRKWSRADDDKLKEMVATYGRRWSHIAEELSRSPEDLMLRYDFKVARYRGGPWTREENKQLIKLVEELGPRWSQIGSIIGRTGPQCTTRYRQTLDPRLKWRLWTPNEDDQLLSLRDDAGYNWAMISATLGRAATSCRYRYTKLGEEQKQNNRLKELYDNL